MKQFGNDLKAKRDKIFEYSLESIVTKSVNLKPKAVYAPSKLTQV